MSTATATASIVSLRRYPVKSMMGEEVNAIDVTDRGLLGDRAYALVDSETGKVVSAKNPRKWPGLFDYRAAFTHPPHAGEDIPPVRITLPDGIAVTSEEEELNRILSNALGREVTLQTAASQAPSLEEYWPDMNGLDHRDEVTDESMPAGTFFDLAVVHLLTTATIDRLHELQPQSRFEARRFRPNIIVNPGPGGEGFVESDWVGRTVAIGNAVRLKITGPCPRCVMTTLPQADLPKDPDVLRTAVQKNEGHVGVYANVEQSGTIRIGDAVNVE